MRAAVSDAIDLAVSDDDHDTLQQQVSELADSDLQHTHDYLHECAADGNVIAGFTKPDMERLHGAVEHEQATRAQAVGQPAPAGSPLQWASGGALQRPLSDHNAARMPQKVSELAGKVQPTSLRDIPQAERDAMPDADFAGKGDSYPIRKPEDVDAAAHAIGRAGDDNYSADQLKKNIIAIAKRKGAAFVAQLPDAWKADLHAESDPEVLRGCALIGTISLNSGSTAQSWIQVAKTGEFVSSRYGEFAITKGNLDQMLRNFKTKMPQPPTRIPVDYDHLSMDPQRPGDGKAAGWFVDLELRANGGELWGLVEWTPDAAEAISKKEYQFVSPSFARNFTDKQGQKIGTTLLAAAITNHPFLEGMAPLTLCADGDLAIQLTSASARSVHTDRLEEPKQMGKTYSMKSTNGQPVDVDEAELSENPFVKKMQADHKQAMDELKADHAKALKKAGDDSKDLRTDNQEIISLREKVSTQSEEIVSLRESRKADRRAMHLRDAQAKFDTLVARGFAKPAEKDRAIKLAKRDLDAFNCASDEEKSPWDLFDDWCKDHTVKVVSLNAEHGSGEGDVSASAVDQIMALTKAKQVEDKTLSFDGAWQQVCRENPELYEGYRKEVSVRV